MNEYVDNGFIDRQNPQCEGEHQNRIMFTTFEPPRHRVIHDGSRKPGDNVLTIHAGLAHGITKGSEFQIWENLESYKNWAVLGPIAVVEACRVGPFQSSVEVVPGLSIEGSFIAEHVEPGQKQEMRLHVPRTQKLAGVYEAVLREMVSPSLKRLTICLSTPQDAYVDLIQIDDAEDPAKGARIAFEVRDQDVNDRGLKRLPYTIDSNKDPIQFHRMVHGFAHYKYHLHRLEDTGVQLQGTQRVTIEFCRVEKDQSGSPSSAYPSRSENLITDGKGIDLTLNDSWYIFKIRNQTNLELYPALFFFDSCDFSISKSRYVLIM